MISSNNNSSLKLSMSEEDIKESVKQAVEEMAMREKKRFEHVYLNGESILQQVVSHLKKDRVDAEDMLYFPDKYSFSIDDFMDLFMTMTEYLEELGFVTSEDISFPHKHYFLKYEGKLIEFFTMWGQGTVSIVQESTFEEEELPFKLIGTMEDYEAYVHTRIKQL